LAVESYACSSAEATIKVYRISNEVHTSGRSTPLRFTPLGSTPLNKGSPHQSSESHPRSSSQLSYVMWGPPAPIPTSQRPLAELTHSGERRSTRKESSQVRDQKTIHNQWTQTIAIGLNTLHRLYNCTRPDRARTVANRPKPYHTAGVQLSG
jgi:hypothetical protein